MICVKFTACLLRLASRLANPFGHPSQVRTQVLVLQTCVDLRRLASPFGQGLIEVNYKKGSWVTQPVNRAEVNIAI